MGKVIGCGFCPQTANMTGEHLWSDWFGKKIGIKDYVVTRKEADGSSSRYRKKSLNLKAKVVCETCNNGWMSELENQTRAVIHDMCVHCSPATLQARDIAILAANMFKCAVVADLMHDYRPPFFTLFERRRFAKDLTIPPGVQMWLASMAIPRGLFKSYYLVTKPGARVGFELNVFTFGMGHFVAQVVSSRWKKKAFRRRADPPRLTQNVAWDSVSVPFWPYSGTPVSWPPASHLGHQIVDDFVQRWTVLELGRWLASL